MRQSRTKKRGSKKRNAAAKKANRRRRPKPNAKARSAPPKKVVAVKTAATEKAKPTKTGPVTAAEQLAAKQRDISVSEFFLKNRHLLGFDNPKKALLTTIKEAVDNSLDACEEAKILPEIRIEIRPKEDDRFVVIVEDNGPGIVREQIPNIFGKLLYGSKFHSMKQSRGQQGIGISAAGMYGQLTTGVSTKIISRISPKKPAHYFEIQIDTAKNAATVHKDEVVTWKRPRGTKVEIELEAKFQKGRHSIEDYVRQTAIANPHATIFYAGPDGEKETYKAVSKSLPVAPKEIKPHPHGVELGLLMKMLRSTKARTVATFLAKDFARISSTSARVILKDAGLDPATVPSAVLQADVDQLHRAIGRAKIMNPPVNCLSPIGQESLLRGLKSRVEADFYTALTRPPTVYRGNPFQIEVALAYGGALPKEELVDLMRFANRVPLLYQQSACAITKCVVQTTWRNYGLEQGKGALPAGPIAIAVHLASVWVPFTSESKEAVASYPEIIREVRLALQECGRRLDAFIRKGRREDEARRKRDYIRSYLPHIGIGLKEILDLRESERKHVLNLLTDILERERAA